jgi:Predicted membrane protein
MLSLLAGSMLPVTTFSLTTMVSGFSAATTNATPRATPLVTEDRTAQNAISLFLGSFIYAVTGLTAYYLEFFGSKESFALFCVTVAVMAGIVVVFLRWMDHISALVRVDATTARIEGAAGRAFDSWIDAPGFAARPPAEWCAPADFPLHAGSEGYVQHVDVARLDTLAREAGCDLLLIVAPGSYLAPRRPFARSSRDLPPGTAAAMAGALTIDRGRDFAHDPRFGLITLAEVASRALSPGINDPGTAIAALTAGTRLLGGWIDRRRDAPRTVRFGNVFAGDLAARDLFEDLLRPIARDGAGTLEVAIRFQKMAMILGEAGDGLHAGLALAHARDALARSRKALDYDGDLQVLEAVFQEVEDRLSPLTMAAAGPHASSGKTPAAEEKQGPRESG